MISVFINEEYGFRSWRWDFPGTHDEMIADWKAGEAPLGFFDPSKGQFRGTMTQLNDDEYTEGRRQQWRMGGPSYRAHVHESNDTELIIGFRSPHWKPEDELAPASVATPTDANGSPVE